MLDLLSKIFGPHRAVSIFVFMQNRGIALLAGIAFVAVVGALLFLNSPRRHEHVSFLTLPVITVVSSGGNSARGLVATLRLPDGEPVTVTTTDATISATVTETACVEKRRYLDNGEFRYRLKSPDHCGNG